MSKPAKQERLSRKPQGKLIFLDGDPTESDQPYYCDPETGVCYVPQGSSAPNVAGENRMAIDPVCNAAVLKTTARFSTDSDHGPHLFCSAACKATFDAQPELYQTTQKE